MNSLLGRVSWALADPRFAEAVHPQRRGEGGIVASLGSSPELQGEAWLEGKGGAVCRLEGGGDGHGAVVCFGGEVEARAQEGRCGRGSLATTRVEDELRAVCVGADVACVHRHALDDVGDRVRSRGVEEDFARFGIYFEGLADHHGAEVEGTYLGGGDRDQAYRRAVVGPCQVELARCVGKGGADSRSGQGVADFRCRRAGWAFELFGAAVDAGSCFRRCDRGIGAERYSRQLADHARGQLDREAGELLFCVGSEEAHVEGAEAPGGVVDRTRDQAGAEGRQPP